jgi:tetratricopeptide (TPR) repeat protein
VNSIDPTLYSKNWNSILKSIINNLEEFLEVKTEKIPLIVKFIPVLDFLGYSTDIEKITKEINEIIDKFPHFKINFEFIKLFSRKSYPTINNQIRKVLELKENPDYNHEWYQEAFLWFMINFKFNSKKMIQSISEINLDQVVSIDPFWQCQINFSRAWNGIFAADYDKVYELFYKIQKTINEYKLEICLPNLHKHQGVYYGSRGLTDESLVWFEAALASGREINDKKVIATTENNLGLVYQSLGDFEMAEKYLLLSLQQMPSVRTQVSSLTNLAYNFYLKGALEKASQAYNQANELLKKLPKESPMQGEVKLGLGIIKNVEGNHKEALPLLNEALEVFTKYNDIEAQIKFHGTLVQLFYDSHEFSLVELHYKEFTKKIDLIKSYQNNFSIFAINVLVKLDQKKLNEARQSLEELKELGKNYSKNRLVRIWMNFIQGVYERDLCNLNNAEHYLYKTIQETSEKGPYSLLLRSMVALSDIYHQKYILTNNSIYLDNMESILNQADDIGDQNPVFPIILYVKLNFAMLAASKKEWNTVDELTEEVKQIVSEHGRFSLKKNILTILEQIGSQKYLSGDLSAGMSSLLFIGMGRKAKKVIFNENALGIVMWKLTDEGADPIAIHVPKEVIPEEFVEVALLLMGQLYVAVLGQGEFYHEGLFGPLPVPMPNTEFRCLLSSRSIKDSSQTDSRLRRKNYALIGLVYARTIELDVVALNEILSSWWEGFNDLAEFTNDKFNVLKRDLLKKPIKLELSY